MSDQSPLYVTRPSLPPLEAFTRELALIWDSRVLTNGGPQHRRFEAALAEYLGIGHISLFTNGTIALVTALQALDIEGEVITTPYSFVATAHSLLWNGLTPVFADIDPVSLNLDPARVEAAITPRTRAILAVHCYGRPCDHAALRDIADRHGLRLLYDAAHAFGIRREGASILRDGDLSVMSFHATKVFQTFEGGAIVSPDVATKQRIDRLKNFGFVNEVTVATQGINGKMAEINATLGLLQLEAIDGEIARRAAIAAAYRVELAGIEGLRCLSPLPGANENHGYFPVLVEDGFPLDRDALYAAMRAANIYARRYFFPLISDMPMYAHLPSAAASNLPVARRIAECVLCLPIFADLSTEDFERVLSVVRRAAHRGA